MKLPLLLLIGLSYSLQSFAQIYSESFENAWSGAPAAPSGWTQIAGQTGGGAGSDIAWDQCVYNTGWTCTSGGTKPVGAPDGTAVAHYYNNLSQTGQTDTLKSPTIDLSSTINPFVSFYYNYWEGNSILKVLASADGQTSWIDITGGGIGITNTQWLHFTFNLGSFKTSTMKIAFVVVSENNSNDIWLDNIIVDDAPAPLNGTYTIDNTLATGGINFTSFTDAINSLNRRGISGPVIFNVASSQTFTEETPIIYTTGTSTNTITFQKNGTGSNPVIISAGLVQSGKSGIWVKGGDYFTFDGIDVTASNSVLNAGYYFNNLSQYNGPKYISLKNCKLDMKKPGGIGANASLDYGKALSTAGTVTAISFQNITVEDGKAGLEISGSLSFPADSCIITNCVIGSATTNDIGSNVQAVSGILAYNCKNINISNNHIRNIFGAATSTSGIRITFAGNRNIISNNLIHSIRGTGNSASDFIFGINSSGYSLLDTIVICNNMIYDMTHALAVPSISSTVRAISLNPSSVGIHKVHFNTVYINSGSIASSYVLHSSGGANIIRNNIFYNASPGGSTSKRYVIRYNAAGTVSNNNILLKVSGTNNFIGYNGADKITLADWQASTGTPDLNSYSIDPMFVSATNLHFTNKAMNNLGVPISGITTDFDGETRSVTTPDIGADEFDDILLLPPVISPANGSTDVNVITDVTFTFPENIRNIDNSAITSANVASLISFKDASLNNISFTAVWDAVNNKITITPSAQLNLNTQYTVSVSGVEDSWENTNNFSTTFTTVSIITTVSIGITSGTNPSCQNAVVTFTAVPENGGTNPSYQWMVNGSNTGTNSNIFTTTSLATNDIISCEITSNDPAVIYPTALSNTIQIQIVNSTYRDTAAVVCESYTWHGNTYTVSDTVTYTLPNATGCDSIISLHLTVINLIDQNVTAATTDMCNNGSTTIDVAGSQTGVTYYLRDNSDNSNLDTLAGTGSAVSFPVSLSSTKSYNILAEKNITSGALNFSGSNQYISVPNNAELTITSSITIEAWVYVPSNFYGIRTIANKSGAQGYGLVLGDASNSNYISFFLGSFVPRLMTPSNTIILGAWQHIAATFNDVSDEIKIYLNGNVVASGTFTENQFASTANLTIGATNNGTANFFYGALDEFRLWDISRSQTEIQASMNTALLGSEPNLVAYYRFNEGTGTSVIDLAGGNYNGTTQNMTDLNRISRNLLSCTKVLTDISTITVHPNEDATFTYSSNSFCNNNNNPTAIITGTQGGTFSEPSGNLLLNSTNGTINLAGSIPGNYTVTYTTPGFCSANSDFNVSIGSSSTGDTTVITCGSFSWYGTNYTASATPTHTFVNTSGCDSVVTLHLTLSPCPAPTITSISPADGEIGTTVTITGTNFSATPENNIVYFGAIKANVTSATTTSLTIAAPAQAGSVVSLSVLVDGKQVSSINCTTPYFTFTKTPNPVLEYKEYFHSFTNPKAISISDFNNDGIADIATAGTYQNNSWILSGNGNGTFNNLTNNYTIFTNSLDIAVNDFNGDGFNDIVKSDINNSTVSVFSNDGSGQSAPPQSWAVGAYPRSVTTGHFNDDGIVDIAVTCWGDSMIYVLHGIGNSQFSTAVSFSVGTTPISIATADLNHDGFIDLITANVNSNNISILFGDGTGGFSPATNFTTPQGPSFVVACDFNKDGNPDIATSNIYADNISILLGDGAGNFSSSINYSVGNLPSSISVGDLNGDNNIDLIVGNEGSAFLSILIGDGTGNFTNAADIIPADTPTSIATGDFNGDGKTDIAVTENTGLKVWLNCVHTESDTIAVACDYYQWGTYFLNASGDYNHTLVNAAGCDSVITLHLTINNSNSSDTSASSCNVFTWYGVDYTSSGNFTKTFTNISGCDSVVTLHLTINSSSSSDTVATACNNFTWYGTDYNTSGNYTKTLSTVAGCDSVVTLHLTVNYSNSGTDIISSCGPIFWIDGNFYNESNNTATYTLLNASGCDSVVTLNLTVNYSDWTTDDISACDSYTWIDGNTYNENNNTATYTLTNIAGCDSVVTLNLTINNSNTGDTSATACNNFVWYGIDYNTSGDYTKTLTNISGCDSVITLHLTINNSSSGTDVITACESITWIDGNIYNANNNSATFSLTNAAGCDSLVTLNLTINSSFNISLGNDDTLCSNNSDVLVLDAGINGMSYLWNDNSTDQTLTVNSATMSPGVYDYSVSVTDGICTDVDSVVITVEICSGISANNVSDFTHVYPNPSADGIFNVEIRGNYGNNSIISVYDATGRKVFENKYNTTNCKIDMNGFATGMYTLVINTERQGVSKRIVITEK